MMALLWETRVLKTGERLGEPSRHLAVSYTKKIYIFFPQSQPCLPFFYFSNAPIH